MHPKDAGLDALKRIKANTVEKRLRKPNGDPNFNITFYVLSATGEYAGVSMYGGKEHELRGLHRAGREDAAVRAAAAGNRHRLIVLAWLWDLPRTAGPTAAPSVKDVMRRVGGVRPDVRRTRVDRRRHRALHAGSTGQHGRRARRALDGCRVRDRQDRRGQRLARVPRRPRGGRRSACRSTRTG